MLNANLQPVPPEAAVATPQLPYPPLELRRRVGSFADAESELALYEQVGRETHDLIVSALGPKRPLAGRSVLDFGCGAGRTLRHFLAGPPLGELWGCDIDRPSIEWLRENFRDRVTLRTVDEEPGLDAPDSRFDLVYALSVFTHLSDHWAGWILELHRVLRDDGLLFATFLGPEFACELAGQQWEEGATGFVVLGAGAPWDEGGPCTITSSWWIREHWGRAFEVLALEPGGMTSTGQARQGWALLRKRAVELAPADLERVNPDDARELVALQCGQKAVMRDDARRRKQLDQRIATLEAELAAHASELRSAAAGCAELETELARVRQQLEVVYASKSWRLTAPLRNLVSERRRP
jgi:SAM-dependent methyltransferase